MQVLTTIIGSLYQHIQLSSTRLRKFKDIAELLDVTALKCKPLFEIRWLSLGKCVRAVLRNYESVMKVLREEADEVKYVVAVHFAHIFFNLNNDDS